MNTKEKCLNPHCHGTTYCRGLCRKCYKYAHRLVHVLNKTTWKTLVKNGKCKAIVPPVKKRYAWFLAK